MAIEINTRTKILAGVVVLAAAGAGAWFFLLEDEPPPKPPVAATKPPAKPAAEAKGAPAAPVADAAKQPADAAKPAAAKAPPKPVPTEPAKVVAEFLETSGLKAAVLDALQGSAGGSKSAKEKIMDPAVLKELNASEDRLLGGAGLLADVSAALVKAYDANRMPRYLQLLREPAVQKIVALNVKMNALPEKETDDLLEKAAKSAPAEARAKLIARIEEVNRPMAIGADVDGVIARASLEGTLEYMQKDKKATNALTVMGDGNPRNARPAELAKIDAKRGERLRYAQKWYGAALVDASDADLADYLKLVDTEIGEWGATALGGVVTPMVAKRMREYSAIAAKAVFSVKPEAAKAPAKEKPAAEAPAEKPAAAAPKEPPPYQRPANIRDAYTRYNDLVTATVMRDRVAVRELLDGGKHPNARQSDGKTALMIAAGNGDTDIVQMLLAKGADPNLRAAGGITALSTAREARRGDVVQQLERSGAKN